MPSRTRPALDARRAAATPRPACPTIRGSDTRRRCPRQAHGKAIRMRFGCRSEVGEQRERRAARPHAPHAAITGLGLLASAARSGCSEPARVQVVRRVEHRGVLAQVLPDAEGAAGPAARSPAGRRSPARRGVAQRSLSSTVRAFMPRAVERERDDGACGRQQRSSSVRLRAVVGRWTAAFGRLWAVGGRLDGGHGSENPNGRPGGRLQATLDETVGLRAQRVACLSKKRRADPGQRAGSSEAGSCGPGTGTIATRARAGTGPRTPPRRCCDR